MRIVGGKYRGKKLVSPLDTNTRPTLDKTRESIFNIIGPDIYDSVCLDLFAGSGALGIEAISRGASKVYINDIHSNAIKVIKENVSSLKDLEVDVIISSKDYKVFLDDVNEKFDIIFLDPPYPMKVNNDIIEYMYSKGLISDGCIFVVETLKEDNIEASFEYRKRKEYVYGKSKLTIIWK
jgi:16S rRNA (guanine(966)-N(2))-methyltransferase RsmD